MTYVINVINVISEKDFIDLLVDPHLHALLELRAPLAIPCDDLRDGTSTRTARS